MRYLYPSYIQQKFNHSNFKGDFKAVTMFIDVSGFTSMTEKLMQKGKVGAEVLSNILNTIFDPVIKAVYDRGGFISGFAGDAFTAIFIGEEYVAALASAEHIQEIFCERSTQQTKYGTFELSVKIGLSYGTVEWGIPGYEKHKTYYFRGDAIDACAFSEHHCKGKDIVLDEHIITLIEKNEITVTGLNDGTYCQLEKLHVNYSPKGDQKRKPINAETAPLFFPEQLFTRDIIGEFRDIVPVFISYQEPEKDEDAEEFISLVLQTVDLMGGYFNSLDFGDKGANMLVLFGAPVSFENNIERAVNFVLMLKENSNVKFRAGITEGVVYAGFMGSNTRATYTVLGDRVNLAARFMMKASWGELWISERVRNKIKKNCVVDELGEFFFKGKSEPIKCFKLIEEKQITEEFTFENPMIGRDHELEKTVNFSNLIKNGQSPGVLYIYGEAGVGKSRLLYAVKEQMSEYSQMFILAADNIMQKSMNPFITFFSKYFGQIEGGDTAKNSDEFESRWQHLIKRLTDTHVPGHNSESIIKELERTKSLFGALVGLTWKDSLYEQLDAKGRFDNTVLAIKEFFKAEALIRPLIMAFEDVHWMDNDSQEICRQLIRQTGEFPIATIVLSRFYDDGSKPVLKLEEKTPQDEIVLDKLPADSVDVFIETLLGRSASDELNKFILQRTEGNPFYVEQFLMFLKENDVVKLEGDRYILVEKDVEVPSEVKAVLISRIDRLSKELRNVVSVASVIGREIDTRILVDVVKIIDVIAALSEGKIERIWQSVSDALYIFNHTLLRDAAYDMQLTSRLRVLHEHTARSMEKIYREERKYFADIAFHYEHAENVDKTAHYLRKASAYAAESYKNEDALKLYGKLLKYTRDDEEIITIQHKLGNIYKLIGRWEDAEDIYRESLIRSNKIKNKGLIADSMRLIGRQLQDKGKYADAEKMFNDAIKIYEAEQMNAGRCLTTGFIGLIYYYQGDLDKAIVYFKKMLEIAETENIKESISVAYRYLGGVNYFRGDYVQSLEYYKKSYGIVKDTDREIDVATAKGNLGLAYSSVNDFDNALKYYRESLGIYKKLGDRQGVAYTENNMGDLYMWQGKYREAMNSFKNLLHISIELGSVRQIAIAYNAIGHMYKKIHDFDNAEEHYRKAIALAEEHNFGNLFCEFYYELADLYFEMNLIDRSEHLVDGAIRNGDTGKKEFLFKAYILRNRITAIENNKQSVVNLFNMLETATGDGEKAELNYWIYKFTKDSVYRDEAMKLFKILYEIAPREIYKLRISQLEN